MELEKGFYITDGNGSLKTRTVTKKGRNGSPALTVTNPIRLRTIAAARDFASIIEGSAVLCVVADGFVWG